MAFMYEGVNVDIDAPGYPTVSLAVTRANNIVTIANERLVYLDGIETSYMNAYRPLAAAKAHDKTLDYRSSDPSVRNAIIASKIEISKLQPEVTKWTKIVRANQGSININGTPNFTIRRNRYKADIAKNNKILLAAGPAICSGLPPPTTAQTAIMNNAITENAAALTRAETAANTQAGLSNRLNAILDPNQNSNSPGYTEGRNPSTVNGILGGLQGSLDWNATTLLLAFDNTPNSNLYNRPTSAQLASLLKSGRIKNGTPLKQVQSALLRFGRKKPK